MSQGTRRSLWNRGRFCYVIGGRFRGRQFRCLRQNAQNCLQTQMGQKTRNCL